MSGRQLPDLNKRVIFIVGFQEQSGISVVLVYYAAWLVQKTRVTFSTNQIQSY